MLRGGGDEKLKVARFIGFLVSWFVSVLISEFLGFLVSMFLVFNVSKFRSIKDSEISFHVLGTY